MKTVAIVGSKGGVGTTDIAINVALAAASSGQETLLVDMDPRAATASLLLTPADAELSGPVVPTTVHRLTLMRSVGLASPTRLSLSSLPSVPAEVRVLDIGAGHALDSETARSSDLICLVCEASSSALTGAVRTLRALVSVQPMPVVVVLNKCSGRSVGIEALARLAQATRLKLSLEPTLGLVRTDCGTCRTASAKRSVSEPHKSCGAASLAQSVISVLGQTEATLAELTLVTNLRQSGSAAKAA